MSSPSSSLRLAATGGGVAAPAGGGEVVAADGGLAAAVAVAIVAIWTAPKATPGQCKEGNFVCETNMKVNTRDTNR